MTITISKTKATWAVVIALSVFALSILTGCRVGLAKITEPYNDAPVIGHLNSGAEVGSMPDGFNNFAEKCDTHGNRVFVIYHGDRAYGSVFAMKDPTCNIGR